MRKKALIHFGGDKSGSTSIQTALSIASQRDLSGIVYPKPDDELDRALSGHHFFVDVFYRDKGGTNQYFKVLMDKYHVDANSLYEKYIDIITSKDSIILSSEAMSSFDKKMVFKLKKDLDVAGYEEYRLVYYLREPVSYYKSSLQEDIKRRVVPLQPSWHHASSYLSSRKKVISSFSEVFGVDVCVREFSTEKLVGKDVVQDFAEIATDFFGVQVLLKSFRSNKSMSAEELFVLHEYRSGPPFSCAQDMIYFPETFDLIKQLSNSTSETTKITLRPEVKSHITMLNAKDVPWFKERYGIDFSGAEEYTNELLSKTHLRLEEIIVKPGVSSLENIKNQVTFSYPDSLPNLPYPGAALLDYLRSNNHERKALYGCGNIFELALFSLSYEMTEDDFEKIKHDISRMLFVDRSGGVRKLKDFSIVLSDPDDVDWGAVDSVLICTQAYRDEITAYLLEKNTRLLIRNIG